MFTLIVKIFEKIGIWTKNYFFVLVDFAKLSAEVIYWAVVGPFKKRPVNYDHLIDQAVLMGVKSVGIVFFVTFFTGVVLTMQSAYQLSQFGATIYVASLVSVSLCRELGPVLTALVIAGRIGAAITAEIGSMKVSEQIQALETMAINPVRYLMVPKLLALLVMLPCLTVIGDCAGMLGGYLIGVFNLKINSALYIQTSLKFLQLKDIYTGLSKSLVFAAIIALVGCYQGFRTQGGAAGVGQATTRSVVVSFILIIIADCLLTGIYYFSSI